MMTLTERLAAYNAWRRGDETLSQPEPSQIGEDIDEAIKRIDELETDRHMLHSMLATMHGDGGHYRDEHRTVKAVQDAVRKWHDRTYRIAKLEAALSRNMLMVDGKAYDGRDVERLVDKADPPPDGYPSWEDWLLNDHNMRIVPSLEERSAWCVERMKYGQWDVIEFDINGWGTTEFKSYPAALEAAKKEAGPC